MFQILIMVCLGLKNLTGGFGSKTNAVQSLSVTVGDSVSLYTNVTEVRVGEITWKFGDENFVIALIQRTYLAFHTYDGPNGIFRDRLKLDNQTGNLNISNIGFEHAGLYTVEIFADNQTTKIFRISVYAQLPNPTITKGHLGKTSSSSSSSKSYCSVVCSVVNVSAVSLSWYKGNHLLSSISMSDLNTSLSIPLEFNYKENNTYSCVINNTISNHTTHLDINALCTIDEGLPVFYIVFVSASGSLLIGVLTCFICKKWRKTGQKNKHSALCKPKTRRPKSNSDALYENVPKKR